MKKFLLLSSSALLLLAGCSKELRPSFEGTEGDVQTVTFTASIPNDASTKAADDGDGQAASVNRCIMEIYYGGALFTRQYSVVTEKTASFTVNVVSNRTYTVAFWADHVAVAGDTPILMELSQDLYYVTDGSTGLQAVSLKGDYLGNEDARDAFFHCGSYTVKQEGSSFTGIKLYRPFAQMNVITNDLQIIKPVYGLIPTSVDVTLKDVSTTFNALTGEVSGSRTLNYEAGLYNFPSTITDEDCATLSMDYLFAGTEKRVIDIDWKAKKANNADVCHSFTSIPYQRNYRTNVKGALLTTTGSWEVEIDPAWDNEGTGEYQVDVNIANSLEDAQKIINQNAGVYSVTNSVEIIFKWKISGSNRLYIPDNTLTPNWVFKIEDMDEDGQILIEDEHPSDAGVNYKNSAGVALPTGITASQVIFDIPGAHGAVSGDFGRIYSTTSATTLEVKADATVDSIYVRQGNVALYGQVDHIYRADGNAADVIVNVYDGAVWTNWDSEKSSDGIKPVVNLGTYAFDPTGYNVAGSSVKENSDQQTWTVFVTDEWQYYAASEFSSVSGTTVTIMNAAEFALFAKNINANVNYAGYTFVLGTDIDLSAHPWNPVMISSDNGSNITFDGANRTITGLKVNRTESYSGLFGTFFSASSVIRNVIIKNPSVTQTVGTDYTAALCAHIGNGTVENCSVIGGTVDGVEQVGAIVGNLNCGNVYNCTVDGTSLSGVNRVGGIAGKANVDSGYRIIGNTVRNATVTSSDRHDLSGAAAIIAQIITGQNATWLIQDNRIENVKTTTGNDATFVPVGEFRNGSFRADAVSGGHIVRNVWVVEGAPDSYTMYNPSKSSESLVINNYVLTATVGTVDYYSFADAVAAVNAGGAATFDVTLHRNVSWETGNGNTDMNHQCFTTDGALVNLDLNGNEIVFTGAGGFRNVAAVNVSNGSVVDNTEYYAEEGTTAWEHTYLEIQGGKYSFTKVIFPNNPQFQGTETVLDGCTFLNQATIESNSSQEYACWCTNGKVSIKNCIFRDIYRAVKLTSLYSAAVTEAVIDSCEFTSIAEKPGVVIDCSNNPSITISNCSFTGCQAGDQSKYVYETKNAVPTVVNCTVDGQPFAE